MVVEASCHVVCSELVACLIYIRLLRFQSLAIPPAGLYIILRWKGWARSQVRSIKFYIELQAGHFLS